MKKVRFNCDDLEPYYGYGHPQFLNQPLVATGAPAQQHPYGYALQAPVYNQGYAPAPQQNFANDPNPFVTTGLVVEQKVER